MKFEITRIANENVASLLEQGLAAIRSGDVDFDLSSVEKCNTAAVAMVLAWQREANARGAVLRLTGLPGDLESLAQLYGVETLVNGG
jgi:phospholipid transport system transporter-binding protein